MSEAMAMQPRREMTTPDADLLAAAFEENRGHLRTVAYRMLGSVSDADDAVQEVWLRLNRSASDSISNLPGWLTSVVARVSLDMLRARRARHEDYVGSWLPEPVVTPREGNFEALLSVLDPDVVFRIDAGGRGPRARAPIAGAERVARQVLARGRPFARLARAA